MALKNMLLTAILTSSAYLAFSQVPDSLSRAIPNQNIIAKLSLPENLKYSPYHPNEYKEPVQTDENEKQNQDMNLQATIYLIKNSESVRWEDSLINTNKVQ